VSTLLVLVGLGVAGAVAGLVAAWRRADRPADMGAVSHQWIAEHRLGSGPDSRH